MPVTRMAAIVRDVVQREGPIHRSEIVARIRTLWDLQQRAGGRIQAAVEDGINHAVRAGMVGREGEFLTWPGREIVVRDRSEVASTTLRRPELLTMEIDVAIQHLVRENLGATLDEMALHVSRRLGYRTTSAQLRAALIARAEALVAKGALELRGGVLSPL